MTAADVFSAVRALVDDPDGDYATDSYQVPLLNLAQESLEKELFGNPNIGKLKTAVVITNVPAGTTSLADSFDSGKPLELLDEVMTVKEKPTGSPDFNYTDMQLYTDVPPNANGDLNYAYQFNGDNILLPGASQALDIRIFGIFEPSPVKDANSPVYSGVSSYLKFATAVLVSRARGNRDLAADYEVQRDRELANIMNNIIMELQTVPTRMCGYSRERAH